MKDSDKFEVVKIRSSDHGRREYFLTVKINGAFCNYDMRINNCIVCPQTGMIYNTNSMPPTEDEIKEMRITLKGWNSPAKCRKEEVRKRLEEYIKE